MFQENRSLMDKLLDKNLVNKLQTKMTKQRIDQAQQIYSQKPVNYLVLAQSKADNFESNQNNNKNQQNLLKTRNSPKVPETADFMNKSSNDLMIENLGYKSPSKKFKLSSKTQKKQQQVNSLFNNLAIKIERNNGKYQGASKQSHNQSKVSQSKKLTPLQKQLVYQNVPSIVIPKKNQTQNQKRISHIIQNEKQGTVQIQSPDQSQQIVTLPNINDPGARHNVAANPSNGEVIDKGQVQQVSERNSDKSKSYAGQTPNHQKSFIQINHNLRGSSRKSGSRLENEQKGFKITIPINIVSDNKRNQPQRFLTPQKTKKIPNPFPQNKEEQKLPQSQNKSKDNNSFNMRSYSGIEDQLEPNIQNQIDQERTPLQNQDHQQQRNIRSFSRKNSRQSSRRQSNRDLNTTHINKINKTETNNLSVTQQPSDIESIHKKELLLKQIQRQKQKIKIQAQIDTFQQATDQNSTSIQAPYLSELNQYHGHHKQQSNTTIEQEESPLKKQHKSSVTATAFSKFDQVPQDELQERLKKRNDYSYKFNFDSFQAGQAVLSRKSTQKEPDKEKVKGQMSLNTSFQKNSTQQEETHVPKRSSGAHVIAVNKKQFNNAKANQQNKNLQSFQLKKRTHEQNKASALNIREREEQREHEIEKEMKSLLKKDLSFKHETLQTLQNKRKSTESIDNIYQTNKSKQSDNLVTQTQKSKKLNSSKQIENQQKQKINKSIYETFQIQNEKANKPILPSVNPLNYYKIDILTSYHKSLKDQFTEHFQKQFIVLKQINAFRTHSANLEQVLQEKAVNLLPLHLPYDHPNLKKRFLLLDLDETLIHAVFMKEPKDDTFEVMINENKKCYIRIHLRPYAEEFLIKMKKIYNLVIFTASQKAYCDVIVNQIDPMNKFFVKRLYRSSCVNTQNGQLTKDLRIIQGVNLKETVLVDNMVGNFSNQMKNGVPVVPFYGDDNDDQLIKLASFLEHLSKEKDVTLLNTRQFQLEKLSNYVHHEDALMNYN